MNKLQKTNLHVMVAEEIKTYIQINNLKEGDKLPSAAFFSETLGVGRSTVREGIRQLEATGVISVYNGKGIFVNDTDITLIEAKIKVNNEKTFLLQMCEVRRALEGKAVALAAERATDEEISRMDQHLKNYIKKRDAGEDPAPDDLAFHKQIYAAAHNPVLESVLDSLGDSFNKFWQRPFGIHTIFDDTYPLHLALLVALKRRNVEEALHEFDKLMNSVEDTIRNVQI